MTLIYDIFLINQVSSVPFLAGLPLFFWTSDMSGLLDGLVIAISVKFKLTFYHQESCKNVVNYIVIFNAHVFAHPCLLRPFKAEIQIFQKLKKF